MEKQKYAIRRENYPDGTVRAELSFTYDGKQNGVTKTFYPNGTIAAEMIDRESIVRLIMAENGLFKSAPAASRKVVLLNKADTAELQTQAELIARELATPPTNLGCISASLRQGNYMVLLGKV